MLEGSVVNVNAKGVESGSAGGAGGSGDLGSGGVKGQSGRECFTRFASRGLSAIDYRAMKDSLAHLTRTRAYALFVVSSEERDVPD